MAQEDSATGDLPMSEETMEGSRAVPVGPVVPDPLKPKSSKSNGVVPVVPETLETDEQGGKGWRWLCLKHEVLPEIRRFAITAIVFSLKLK
jgi:uncharacterized protein (DUF2235 family)